jgi:triosephosphate isomerase
LRTPLIAGNWKMNGTSDRNQALLDEIMAHSTSFSSVDVAIFPPAIYLQQVQAALAGSKLAWGTQNVSQFKEGAYTGEISAYMLRDFNCEYVLLGHSERRSMYAQIDLDMRVLDRILAEKYFIAVQAGLTPIICFGETPEEHALGQTEEIIGRMLDTVIEYRGVEHLAHTVLAYEPVWAIGTGRSATPEWAQDVHQFMRQRIAKHDKHIAETIRILYGGSINSDNAAPLFSQSDVDGGLVGGGSLNAEEFIKICQAAVKN